MTNVPLVIVAFVDEVFDVKAAEVGVFAQFEDAVDRVAN